MQFGYEISGGAPFTVSGTLAPTLILNSRETFHRLFLETARDHHVSLFGKSQELIKHKSGLLFDGSPIPFNPLDGDPYLVLEAFKAIWNYDKPTVQIDMYTLAAISALKEAKGTFFQLPYLFTSETFRRKVINKLDDKVLIDHWTHYDSLPPREQNVYASPVLNRLKPLLFDIALRRIISQPRSFMQPRVLYVDLPRNDRYSLLAALIMAQVKGVAFIEYPSVHIGNTIPVFHAEYLDQVAPRNSLLATAQIMTTRTGTVDAKTLTPHFNLKPDDFDLTDLPEGRAYVRLEKTHLITTYPHTFKPANRRFKYLTTPTGILDTRVGSFLDQICSKASSRRSLTSRRSPTKRMRRSLRH